jgi:hypothetical protein
MTVVMMAATPAVVALRAGISRLSKSRSTVDEGDADAELLMHLSGHIVSVHACDADGVAGLALDKISRLNSSWSTVDGLDADGELVSPFWGRSVV